MIENPYVDRFCIPPDSCIHPWIASFENTELWWSWRVATALTVIGATLGRKAYIPMMGSTRLWPNTSSILIGISGDGKDTIIRPASELLQGIGVRYVAGKTMEAIRTSLFNIGDPAVGYIVAGELREFLGDKDYQSGIIQSLTDILSNNNRIDISTKFDLMNGGEKYVYNPTLTMFAGSTPEWLHSIKDAMSGGFLPRFLVVTELGKKSDQGLRPIANPGRYESYDQKLRIDEGAREFERAILGIYETYRAYPDPVCFDDTYEADQYFTNWYENRHKYFPATMPAYANRSGGLMKKTAMLMAVSRGNRHIDVPDYLFADALIRYLAGNLEQSVISVPKEVEVGREIVKMLPTTNAEILRMLSPIHGSIWVRRGKLYLIESGQILDEEGKLSKNG